MRRLILALIGCLAWPGTVAPLPGQAPTAVGPGSRVRVTLQRDGQQRIAGTYLGQANDSLTMQVLVPASSVTGPASIEERKLALRDVLRLELSTGQHRSVLKGCLIGLVVGSVVGGGAGYLSGDDPPPQCECEFIFCFCTPSTTAGQKAAWGAAGGGLLGAGIGALVGTATHDRWVAFPVNALRAQPIVASAAGIVRLGWRLPLPHH